MSERMVTRRSKHIELIYNFIRQQVQNGMIKLQYVQSDADIFMKPLANTKFCFYFKNLLNIVM